MREGIAVGSYTTDDARLDLEHLRDPAGGESVERLAACIERLETRAEGAERVCEAAAEMIAPSAKRDLFQQRQTRFLQALAEWRETQS